MNEMPNSERLAASRDESDSPSRKSHRLETLKPRVQPSPRLPQVGPAISQAKVVQRVYIQSDDEEAVATSATIRDRIRRNRNSLSSILISSFCHAFVLLVLLWLATQWKQPTRLAPGLVAEFTDTSEVQQADVEPVQPVNVEISQPDVSPLENTLTDLATDIETMADSEIPSVLPIENPTETPSTNDATLSTARMVATPAGGGLQGRDADARAALAAKHGGSAASEAAVERALEWIVRHQYEDGGWRLQFHDGPCNGRCRHEGLMESPNAATSLALMALMGAGYTSEKGPYQKEVAAGIDFLLQRMRSTSYGGSFREGEKGMYAQGLATMALSEAFALTKNSELAGPITDAVEYIQKAQHRRGGWRYEAGYPGDMLVTGWQLLALKSAQQAGFKVDAEVLRKVDGFVDSLEVSRAGLYRYGPERSGGEPASSAVGMLMKMYLGQRRDHPDLREGALGLSDDGFSPSNIYYNYYVTLVLHHRRGQYWKAWNANMRDFLVEQQVRTGHEAGSWHFDDPLGTGKQGGRLYSTAMAAMTLEVYYRFLPLYGYEPFEVEQEVSTK